MARWGNQPHFVSVVGGRVPTVSDETTNPADQGWETAANPPIDAGDAGGHDELHELDGLIDETQDALHETRRRLAEVPADIVIANHVMGLYELAAIHLGANPPDLAQAALAIDAVGCLVEGLGPRLGPDAPTLTDALANIRLASVQIKDAQG